MSSDYVNEQPGFPVPIAIHGWAMALGGILLVIAALLRWVNMWRIAQLGAALVASALFYAFLARTSTSYDRFVEHMYWSNGYFIGFARRWGYPLGILTAWIGVAGSVLAALSAFLHRADPTVARDPRWIRWADKL
jgi:hypothetical protein